jgi:hypothetical protein
MKITAGGDCPSCGAQLPVDARWCGRCGAHQHVVGSPQETDPQAAPDTLPEPDLGRDADRVPDRVETSATARTAVAERLGWFAAGVLAAGAIALAVSSNGSPVPPPTGTPVSGESVDEGVPDAEPDPFGDGDEAADAIPSDQAPEPTTPTDETDDADGVQAQQRRDSLTTCRTVDGEPCGPAYDLDVTATSDLRIVGDHLLALDREGRIRSLSVATGQQLWQRSSGMRTPEVHLTVAEDRDQFIVWSPTLVQARDLDSGEVQWETFYADASRTGAVRPFGSVHLIDDAVVLLGSRTVTVLDGATGSTNHQVMIEDGQVRLLPDGFAITDGDLVRRWDTVDPTPRWQETFPAVGEVRFVDQPPAAGASISAAPLAVAGSTTGDIVGLDPANGDRLVELSGSEHHVVQRLGGLLISVSWPDSDGAMARVVATQGEGTTDAMQVPLPCCGASVLPGPDDFVAIAAPRVGSQAVLVDVDRGVRLELVRPDEIVGQRTPIVLTSTLAMWRSPTGQVGADQLTGRIHWRSSANATPLSIDPLILAGERSVVWVTAPLGTDR